MDIAGKTAVVTGGGSGIGRSIALALASGGCNVGVADIEMDAAEGVAAEVEAAGVRGAAYEVDVAGEADVEALAERSFGDFGSVEILVNNAGVLSRPGPLLETSASDYDWVFAVNVRGMLNGIRSFGRRFAASEGPCWIVNTGSEHCLGVPHLYSGLYTASKHAALGLSAVLRGELPGHVGVSVLCPGLVDTGLWRSSERRQERFGGAAGADPASAAVTRLGMAPDEVAARVVEGIRDETFYIVSHSHVIEFAQRRWEEIAAAFEAQAPRRPGDEEYSVENVMARLTGGG
ncbi:MAG: SDR family NAD(P)-dependent oxidoreductase [Acidobacteriota bacterium]|nr:SDR family NAD(P)-dependent oxidoreductase [Acidobacteriota bacterium]